MRKILCTLSLLLFNGFLFSQEILLDEVVKPDTTINNFAPDGKNHFALGVGIGFASGNEGGPNGVIQSGRSTEFQVIANYRRLFAQRFGLGARITFSNQNYTIDQNIIERERLILNYFNLEGYMRFVLSKKPNKNGLYIDAGGYAGLLAGSRWHLENELNQNQIAESSELIYRKLDFLQQLNYGVGGRLGLNSYAIYVKYRLTDLFDHPGVNPAVFYPTGKLFDEFPRIMVGLEIGL